MKNTSKTLLAACSLALTAVVGTIAVLGMFDSGMPFLEGSFRFKRNVELLNGYAIDNRQTPQPTATPAPTPKPVPAPTPTPEEIPTTGDTTPCGGYAALLLAALPVSAYTIKKTRGGV